MFTKRKTVLKVKYFNKASFKRFKGSLCELWKHQGKVPGGDAPPTLESVSVEAIQETSEIIIFAVINGGISQFVCSS